jgi:glucokinase
MRLQLAALNERVLCGAAWRTSTRCCAALTHDGLQPTALREPADIVEAALEGHDGRRRRSLARFCSVLAASRRRALIHGARTVVIAGGMVPRFIPVPAQAAPSASASSPRAGSRPTWNPRDPRHHPSHPGLLGAATAYAIEPRSARAV